MDPSLREFAVIIRQAINLDAEWLSSLNQQAERLESYLRERYRYAQSDELIKTAYELSEKRLILLKEGEFTGNIEEAMISFLDSQKDALIKILNIVREGLLFYHH